MKAFVVVSIGLVACSSPAPQKVTLAAPSGTAIVSAAPVVHPVPVNVPTAYFPPGTFPERADQFVSDWYGRHLGAMHEPSLWAAAVRGETVWRFVYLRTWGKPIAIRVTSDGHLFATRLGGQGGYDPGTIDVQRERVLAKSDLARIDSALAAMSFDTTATEGEMGNDGAQWVLERAKGGQYRLVERWSPDVTHTHPAFLAACDVFIDLAGRDLL
ncbi:MAG TPA: hypothetical protein VGH87_09770 [Polyangiaceae bacterium]